MAAKTLKTSPRKPVLSVVSAKPTGEEARTNEAAAASGSDAGSRRALIAQAAYLRAERRGFEPGHELDDWCAAERDIDDQLFRGEIPAS